MEVLVHFRVTTSCSDRKVSSLTCRSKKEHSLFECQFFMPKSTNWGYTISTSATGGNPGTRIPCRGSSNNLSCFRNQYKLLLCSSLTDSKPVVKYYWCLNIFVLLECRKVLSSNVLWHQHQLGVAYIFNTSNVKNGPRPHTTVYLLVPCNS